MENSVVEVGAVAVDVLHVFGEKACADSRETDAKLIVEKGIVQHGGCEVHRRQSNLQMRQYLSDTS